MTVKPIFTDSLLKMSEQVPIYMGVVVVVVVVVVMSGHVPIHMGWGW